ncbi:MAG: biotin/lipoyl-binding protein [Lachnospiraceae bacterium]|nr:biotin/lipoyl-binding protein [Lachnospiraceae bacterium]
MKNIINERANVPLTTTLSKRDLTSSISVTGTIASADKRSVSTSLTNTEIKEVNVCVGDYVNAGDTIITFDSSDLEKELETAENSLEINSLKNQKTLSDAAKAVEDAQNNYNNQAAGLQEDVNIALSNYNTLCVKRDSALSEYQTAQTEVQTALSEYDTLKTQAETEGWSTKVADAKTLLDAAQAEYDKAEAVSDVQLTSDLYDTLQLAKSNYDNTVLQYENPLTVAQSKIDTAKQKESQALASYEEYSSQADAAYGAYYGKINTQTETNEKNAKQIEESKYNYQITSLEQKNSKITENDQVQNVEEKLGEVVVTSPISGVITTINVEAGDQYEGGTLFVVEDMEHFIVDASVDNMIFRILVRI